MADEIGAMNLAFAVCAALVACKRLADTTGEREQGGGGGGAGGAASQAEAEAVELQTLRRDLSAAKLALAEAELARDAAQLELRTLREQQSQKGSRARGSMFSSA